MEHLLRLYQQDLRLKTNILDKYVNRIKGGNLSNLRYAGDIILTVKDQK